MWLVRSVPNPIDIWWNPSTATSRTLHIMFHQRTMYHHITIVMVISIRDDHCYYGSIVTISCHTVILIEWHYCHWCKLDRRRHPSYDIDHKSVVVIIVAVEWVCNQCKLSMWSVCKSDKQKIRSTFVRWWYLNGTFLAIAVVVLNTSPYILLILLPTNAATRRIIRRLT